MQEVPKQSYTVSIAPQKQSASVGVDKRKSVDDPLPSNEAKPPDIWPQKRKASSSSSSPVKAVIQDIDMESIPSIGEDKFIKNLAWSKD